MLRPQRPARPAFTLIELVVVLVIVATLAALAIPAVSMLTRSSNMAASAKTQADLANNIQLYFTLQKRYPQGLDSLLDSAGAIYGADTTSGDTQTRGLPYNGADGTRLEAQLTASDLTNGGAGADYLKSVSRAGFDWVYDHSTAAGINSNNSTAGAAQRLTSTSPFKVAEVTGAALIAKLVPQGLTSTQRLVAFGFGPRNSAVSKTITNCPTYPGADGRYYGRFVPVFMIYGSGERATLVAVIDPYGRHSDFTIQQFNESMPDGSRQD